jgi:hypothetical protein
MKVNIFGGVISHNKTVIGYTGYVTRESSSRQITTDHTQMLLYAKSAPEHGTDFHACSKDFRIVIKIKQ